MSRHFDELEIASAVAGLDLSPERAAHLAACLDCSRQVAETRRVIEGRRLQLTAGEPDWEASCEAVLARLEPPAAAGERVRRTRWWRPLAAAAAAAVVVAAVGLLTPGKGNRAPAQDDLAVDEILAEVDEVLADDSIPGFEVIDPGVDSLEAYAANGAS